jgi:glycosyltransferase involved in cell wall biosynthesis
LKISFSTIAANARTEVGYGQAGLNMILALQQLGHQVPFEDASAPVEIAFNQPQYTQWSNPDAYHIQYTPWESTVLPYGWVDHFNRADEVWTPSPVIAGWYKDAGVEVPIKVYEHGVNPMWTFKRRRLDGPIQFLHHGEPAPRKGGQMALDAFREVFGASDEAFLTIKSHGETMVRHRDREGNIRGTADSLGNVRVIRETYPDALLVNLYHNSHALVYPGYGEGFGLIPLQALATGMPTICTGAWAPYKRYLDPQLTLGSAMIDSPWQAMHPGKVFEPNYDDLLKAYRELADDYNTFAGRAFRRSFDIRTHYDWVRLTEEAFADVVAKFA